MVYFVFIFNFICGLKYFRAFESTRFYTRLIITAAYDSFGLLLILAYSIFSFGFLYYVALDELSPEDSIKFFYEINLGVFSNENFSSLEYFLFTLATLFNAILILNLLIPVFGNTLDKLQTDCSNRDYLDMLRVIIEIEEHMFWNKNKGQNMFLQKCDYGEKGRKDKLWQGKSKEFDNKINQFEEFIIEKDKTNLIALNSYNQNQIENFSEKVSRDTETKLKNELSAFEDRIDQKLNLIDHKINIFQQHMQERDTAAQNREEKINELLDSILQNIRK